MKNKHNQTMSHNACYAMLPSSEVIFLRVFQFRTEVGLYYIRLYFDKATGFYFYTLRADDSSVLLYSCGFHSELNALVDIRCLVSHYLGCHSARILIPLNLQERA